MTQTPDSLIETPYRGGAVPGPAGNDVLSDALRVFRVTDVALLRGEFKATWSWDAPPASAIAAAIHTGAPRLMLMHIVTEGSCWVEVDGMPRRSLAKCSIVGFQRPPDGRRR